MSSLYTAELDGGNRARISATGRDIRRGGRCPSPPSWTSAGWPLMRSRSPHLLAMTRNPAPTGSQARLVSDTVGVRTPAGRTGLPGPLPNPLPAQRGVPADVAAAVSAPTDW